MLTNEPIEFSCFRNHRPNAREDYVSHLDSMEPERRSLFRRLLGFVHENLLETDHVAKIVNKYTGQPDGCNGVPMLVFGKLSGGNMAANSWVARITLGGPLRIVLPRDWLAEGAQPPSVSLAGEGDGTFSPNDNEDFLSNPSRYLRDLQPRRQPQ